MASTASEAGLFVEWGAVLGASLAAALCDMKTGRIPNLLTFPVTLVGLIVAAWVGGLAGLGMGLLGWGLLALPYVLLFVLGRGGAGDAKVMGAVGVWLGVRSGLIVLACVACAGGLMALLRVALHRQRWTILRTLGPALYVQAVALAGGGGWHLLKTDPEAQTSESGREVTIPYGVAIFLGVCLGAMVVNLWMQ